MPLLVMAAVGTYIVVAGRTGTGPACTFITDTVGLSEGPRDEGATVAGWSLTDLAGEGVESTALKGKVVLVNFWSAGCLPYRRELLHLQALQERLGPEGFTVIGIAVDPEDPAGAAHGRLPGGRGAESGGQTAVVSPDRRLITGRPQ